MSAISQKYNTYLQGMSDQPDEIMKPGQLKDSLNTFPDVTFGLLKRPALGFTRLLDTPDHVGCWGSYYRVTNTGERDEYLIQVLRNGRIRIFDAQNGKRQTVDIGGSTADGATLAYGVHTNNSDIQFTTILDTTIINNRTISPRMDATRAPVNQVGGNWYAFIAITQLAYGQSYTIDVTRGGTTTQVTFNTPTDGSTATSVEAIRDDLVADLNGMGGWVQCLAIGNGIYLEDDEAFTLETPELQLFDLIVTAEERKKILRALLLLDMPLLRT